MVTQTDQVTVLIADDHPVYRSGLARMIEGREDLDLVAEAESGSEALAAIRELAPQVAVVDLKMPDMDGIALLGEIKREDLETKVVMLTGYATGETAYEVMAAGAAAYISKTSEPADGGRDDHHRGRRRHLPRPRVPRSPRRPDQAAVEGVGARALRARAPGSPPHRRR